MHGTWPQTGARLWSEFSPSARWSLDWRKKLNNYLNILRIGKSSRLRLHPLQVSSDATDPKERCRGRREKGCRLWNTLLSQSRQCQQNGAAVTLNCWSLKRVPGQSQFRSPIPQPRLPGFRSEPEISHSQGWKSCVSREGLQLSEFTDSIPVCP